MKVMTFNLRSDSVFDGKNRWRKRNHIVFDVLKKYNCDVIGLQEVTHKMYHPTTSAPASTSGIISLANSSGPIS